MSDRRTSSIDTTPDGGTHIEISQPAGWPDPDPWSAADPAVGMD